MSKSNQSNQSDQSNQSFLLPQIIYEDNHLLAVNKPAGWLVQGDKTGDSTLLDWGKAYLKERYAKPGAVYLHPTHRIDRPVSGAVVLARTDKALGRMTTLFREKKVLKIYIAVLLNAPYSETGTLRHFLWKDEKKNIVTVHQHPYKDAKESITRYEVIGQKGNLTLARVSPITGRSHQIRAQLAAIGCPILGDLKYGAPTALPDASIGLHSRQIVFDHPVKLEQTIIEAPFPDAEWWDG